jgi:hypothetical protein
MCCLLDMIVKDLNASVIANEFASSILPPCGGADGGSSCCLLRSTQGKGVGRASWIVTSVATRNQARELAYLSVGRRQGGACQCWLVISGDHSFGTISWGVSMVNRVRG